MPMKYGRDDFHQIWKGWELIRDLSVIDATGKQQTGEDLPGPGWFSTIPGRHLAAESRMDGPGRLPSFLPSIHVSGVIVLFGISITSGLRLGRYLWPQKALWLWEVPWLSAM